jgi:hypothetical protein
MAASGMLGDLFSPKFKDLQAEEAAEEQRTQFLAQDPFKAMAHTAYSGATLAGKGLGRAAAALTGRDPRTSTERNVAAVEAAKAQVAQLGFDPADPKSTDQFYKQVIQILQKQGLPAEAMAVAKEWNTQKLGDGKLRLENDRLERQRANDLRIDARAAERNALLKEKLGAPASQVGKLWADMERATDPAKRASIAQAIGNLTAQKWEAVDLGDRVELRNKVTGELIGSEEKGLPPKDIEKAKDADAKAVNAFGAAHLKMQADYDAAVDLYNHPGLAEFVGRWSGIAGETPPDQRGIGTQLIIGSLSDKGRGALAKFEQVRGSAFLAAFQELKQASPNGSAGFGALSDAEGARIQAAKAALNPRQGAASFRAELAKYISQLEASWNLFNSRAPQENIPPRPLQTRALGAPKGKAAVAAPAPAAVPAGDRVRVKAPDGSTGTIARDKLDAAKARGYTEIP